MTAENYWVFFVALVVAAAVPGPGVYVVVARSLSGGLPAGCATSAGVVLGDYVFIVLSVLGLAALAQAIGAWYALLQAGGGLYLIYLGVLQALVTGAVMAPRPVTAGRLAGDLAAGFLTTLANPKALLFYVSLLPAVLDLSEVAGTDIVWLLAVATLAIGGVMVAYAVAVQGAWLGRTTRVSRAVNLCAGAALVGTGVVLLFRALRQWLGGA